LIKRTVRGVIHLIGGLGAGVAIIVMLVAWQFSRGPIPLGFLSSYIETAVNTGERAFTLKMGETILTWAGWERALDIRVLDVRVVNDAGTTIGSIPEVAFSISGDALIRGKLAPKSVDLFGPKLRFRRDRDGTIDIGFGGQSGPSDLVGLDLVNQLLEPGGGDDALSYLSRLAVIGGEVTFTDQVLKKSWHMPGADLRLTRFADHIEGEMALLLDVGGRQTELEVSGEYLKQAKRLNLGIQFAEISPSMFAAIAPKLGPLGALEMPFSGRVTLGLPVDGTVDTLAVTLTGGPGKLNLPKPFQQSLDVQTVELKAGYSGGTEHADIKNLTVTLAPGSRLNLPAPISHALPLRSFTFTGHFSKGGQSWDIQNLTADLEGGTAFTMKGAVSGIGGAAKEMSVETTARLTAVPIDRYADYWPKSLGTDAHNWVQAHMSKGTIPAVDFKGAFKVPTDGGPLQVVELGGTMSVKGTVVDYLPPLPAVHDVDAHMVFDASSYTIHIDKGSAAGVRVRGGTVAITGLDQYDQFADIDLRLDGKVPAQLAYIDKKPLQFASALGIDPKGARGDATTRLKLYFILEKTLTWDQVQVWARSRLTKVSLANVFLGRGIRDGDLDLRVDRRGMDVNGTVKFDKIPASLKWRENFTDKQEFRSRYNLKAHIADVAHIRDLGLDMEPFSGQYIRGAVDAGIEFTVLSGVDRRLKVEADIIEASLSAPAFGWQKAKGTKGRAAVVMNLAGDLVVDIPDFSVRAADLEVKGAAKYALDGTGLERIDFAKVAYGRTAMKGALIPKPDGGWEAGFHGASFDLSPIWEDILAASGESGKPDGRLLDKLTLAVEFDKVWLDETAALESVSGTFVRDQDLWQTVLLRSRVAGGATFDLEIKPGADGNRRLAMHSDNAGDILKFLDFYPNMVGGQLNVSGTYDDAAPGQPLTGLITVNDYRIANAPVLARLLSIMALTGIMEALEGEGLAFSDLRIPFELNEGTFRLNEARATGTSLGFTANGNVFRHADVVDLQGTVIPAYAINSVFGNIPLLGDILTGGEKGGGVFAARYTMTGPTEEPVVSVNPLSALTPGILRNVFGIFGKAGEPPEFPGADSGQVDAN